MYKLGVCYKLCFDDVKLFPYMRFPTKSTKIFLDKKVDFGYHGQCTHNLDFCIFIGTGQIKRTL